MIPADAELTVRHDVIPAWDDMPDELKPVLAREMEVYAGFLEHTDHHVGRLIDALEDLEILDDTSSTTSSATTVPPPKAHSTGRSTRWPTSTGWPPWRRPSS